MVIFSKIYQFLTRHTVFTKWQSDLKNLDKRLHFGESFSVKGEVFETEISRSSGGNNNYVLLLLRVKSFLVGTVTSKNLRIFSFNHS